MSRNTFIFSLALVGLIASALLVSTRFDSVAIANTQDEVNAQHERGFDIYRVRAGDTLYSLSQTTYGDARHWLKIANENGFASDQDLRAGEEIRIPHFSADELAAFTKRAPEVPHTIGKIEKRSDESMTISEESTTFDHDAPLFAKPVTIKSDDYNDAFVVVEERDGSAYLKVQARYGDFFEVLFDEDLCPAGGKYRYSFVKDLNKDGNEEIYTVWSLGDDDFFTQEIQFDGKGFTLAAMHPNSSFAIGFQPESLSPNAELMKLEKSYTAND